LFPAIRKMAGKSPCFAGGNVAFSLCAGRRRDLQLFLPGRAEDKDPVDPV